MFNLKLIISVIIFIFISNNFAQGSYSKKPSEVSEISSDGYLFTEFKGDLLTVDIREVNLEQVLRQISSKNGITFLLPPSLGEEKVMVRFSSYKIDEGLNKILAPYNRIFIYNTEENNAHHQSPLARLKEVRIYPRSDKGGTKGKVELASIKPAREAKSKGSKRYGKSGSAKKWGKKSVVRPSKSLKRENQRVTVEKVRAWAKRGDVIAIKQLSSALKDKNPEVRKEAEKALEEIGERMREESENESQSGNDWEDWEDLPPPPDPAETNLTITTGPENGVNLELSNKGAVRGMQFTIKGAKPKEIIPINRAEGFFAKYNEKTGMVVLVSISGKTIAPGTGPIAEIICDKGSSPSLSDIKIQ